ncbi:diphosphomevalonate decarboxylase [candidate division KSB1 bacterium]|nr:diphosphomevalonate decarboxylase [candidate division KSB1 bacterium]
MFQRKKGAVKATAIAHSNIALIKYWGRAAVADPGLNIPLNDNISFTKNSMIDDMKLQTITTIHFDEIYDRDSAEVNGEKLSGRKLERILRVIDVLRSEAKSNIKFRMKSINDFPTQAGLASSASAFAALTLATASALGLKINREQLSTVARLGSGSAARSLHDGFVYFHSASSHEQAFAEQICEPGHCDMHAVIAIVDESEKKVTSDAGHDLSAASPFNDIRIQRSAEQVMEMRQAILEHDFSAVGKIAEANCKYMHAVMMTSEPPLFYWNPETLRIIKKVMSLRQQGLETYFTIDAGPNVHCLCRPEDVETLTIELAALEGVKKLIPVRPGRGAYLADEHLF